MRLAGDRARRPLGLALSAAAGAAILWVGGLSGQAPAAPGYPASGSSPARTLGAAPLAGFAPADASGERAAESRVIGRPAPLAADSFSRVLSREPHVAGMAAQARTRDYVLDLMRRWGLRTEVRAYDVYMPYPIAIHVWSLGAAAGDSAELTLEEGPVAGDSTSSAFPQVPTFNAYSGTGSAAGEVVYVNYGLREDYAHLDSAGVSVAGKVVVARYGHSFRGIKAREAERHGAAALLIYSDPADDGYVRGDIYPEGPMRPERGVQRGSIMNGNGDPSTPDYPSTAGARRLDPTAMGLPRIPVVPIAYSNAARLLRDLRGNGSVPPGRAGSAARSAARLPQPWQGGLPFRYHVGPGPTRARVMYEAETGRAAYHTIWDTFGVIPGSEYPDEWVIVGAHRDAWGPGAADNVSGVVTVLEMAQALAEEVRAGHRPKRTVVLATWDAEEWGLIGSTEYVEDDSLRLLRRAVAYLNVDVAADGPTFGATGSPSLRQAVREVSAEVPHPDALDGQSVLDVWRVATPAAGADTTGPAFGDPGGGSDFAGFANHLGIPIIAWGFGGADGVYHSAYDDYAWESRFGDPGFRRHAAAARIGAALTLRLADAEVLPYDYVEYARTMRRYLPRIDQSIAAHGWPASTAPLAGAIDDMERAATAWTLARDSALQVLGTRTPRRAAFRTTNAALLRVERSLTRPTGLRTRPWYRSLVYAADEDNGYADVPFPSVAEAVRSGDRDLTAREITDLAARFASASAALRDAAGLVRTAAIRR